MSDRTPLNVWTDSWCQGAIQGDNQPHYHSILPEKLYVDMRTLCTSLGHERIDIAAANIFASVSSVCCSDTAVQMSSTHQIKPNIFLSLIAPPNFGKSPLYNMLYSGPIGQVEADCEKELTVEQFTDAAFYKHLKANDGVLTITGDEFVSSGMQMLNIYRNSTSHKSNLTGFRGQLNKFFSGGSLRKTLGNHPKSEYSALNIKTTSVSVFGLTQPGPMCDLWEAITQIPDGSKERWLLLNAAPGIQYEEPVAIKTAIAENESTPEEIVNRFTDALVLLRRYLSSGERTFTFSEDVQNELKEARIADHDVMMAEHAERQRARRAAAAAEAGIENADNNEDNHGDATVAPAASGSTYGKVSDYEVKIAWSLHVLSNFYGLPRDAMDSADFNIPTEITAASLHAARLFINVVMVQMSYYDAYASASLAAKSPGTPIQQPMEQIADNDVKKAILLSPGPATSTTIIIRSPAVRSRKRGRLAATKVHAVMDELAEGEEETFGGTKRVRFFIKAKPEEVGADLLQQFNISMEEYAAAYVQPLPVENTDQSRKHVEELRRHL